ncbi:hypothetical protein NPJ88_000050 [Halomonas elongata]|uniref:hypothetical protein n=1 Tax=Halomonas elongata TaxID=2746 RepID=UPI00255AC216|nr:hypothetical protein [Halomonas elongata]MDL4860713.1 hypothetical protein [Halomonas elongata]
MKKWMTAGITAILMAVGSQASAAEDNVSVAAIAGTTGFGADVAWRFHDNFGLSAGYTGGLTWDGDYDTDEVNYEGNLDISASSLKLAYHPFGGSFYLTAGAMLPDMEANVDGRAKNNEQFDFNGNTYTTAQLGTVHGKMTIANSVQPYLGMGWRSTHESGLGFFSEFGVMSTDVDVDLSTSNNYEASNAQFRRDLEEEEQELKDDADKLSVYPVVQLGVSYTF